MKKDFDILEYPFKANELNPLSFVKTRAGYEAKICSRLDSKKILATKSRRRQRYIHVEIGEDGCRMAGHTDNLYVFSTPADFYVPVSADTRDFYEDVYTKLVHGDMDECLRVAEMFDQVYRSTALPEYPIPITSTVESFENYNLKDFKGGKDDTGDTMHVSYEDETPTEPVPGLFKKLQESHGSDVFRIQNEVFVRIFSMHPILRISNIMKIFNSDDVAMDTGFGSWKVRKLLPLYAYFITSGPWRGCWTRFGYNPKSSSDNFRYQIYDSRKSGKMFQVFEAEDIIHEVERNRAWYLSGQSNSKTGFHTKALLNLLKFRSELDFNVDDNEEESNLEFEVFD